MTTTAQLIDRHYGFGSIMEKIESGLNLAGMNLNALTVDDLAPIDEFHTRGKESTLELSSMAIIQSGDQIIDIGCGLGGTARYLAQQYHCSVTGIDLTEEYIQVGNRLTQMVLLDNLVQLKQANALDIPYEDGLFDIAWTEHAQMNIEEKNQFYSEITRVIKPGGCLLFHDIFRGSGSAPFYPTPWAEDESISYLATETQAQTAIENQGLIITQWIPKVEQSLEYFKNAFARIDTQGPPPIGIHLLMGDNAKEKMQNYVRNLSENRTTVIMGMACK